MAFGEKLGNKLSEKNISQATLSEKTGIPKSTLNCMISRDVGKVDIDIFLRICKVLDVNPEEFYNECKASKIVPSFEQKYNAIDDYGRRTVDAVLNIEYERCINDADNAKPKIITFKRFNINKASAGCGYDLSNSDEWAEIKVVDTPEAREADFAVEIDGNSMAPTFHDGDIVYVVVDNDVQIGEIGLFRQNGNGFIKERGEHYLISHNEKYPNIYPEDGEINCVGRVIGIAEIPE